MNFLLLREKRKTHKYTVTLHLYFVKKTTNLYFLKLLEWGTSHSLLHFFRKYLKHPHPTLKVYHLPLDSTPSFVKL